MIFIEGVLKHYISFKKTEQSWPQVYSIFVVGLGAFTCGAFYSWTSPSIPILISNSSEVETITLEVASYFTVIPPVAAALSVPFLSMFLDIVGRRKMLIFIAAPHILAWILILFAENYFTFYLSRVVSGIADAITFCALPIYIGEVSTPSVRGSWGNLFAISICVGQFFINVVGAYCSIRTTACIFCCAPIIYGILSLTIPESPYYLIMKGRETDARDALRMLRWTENIDEEFMILKQDVQRQVSETGTFKDLFTIPSNRKALLISITARAGQQLSGVAAFGMYTQFLFNQAGGNISASTSSIIYSAALLAMVIVAAFFVDKFGRKILMTFSSFSCGIVLVIMATYFYINTETSIDISNLKWLPITGMVLYIVASSSGLAVVPTLMMGELFSASIKSKALCVLNICFSIFVITVSKLFQVLTVNFGMYVPFYFFSACCFGSTILSYYCILETKGKTLEEIQQALRK